MKASELIASLQEYMERHGDREVIFSRYADYVSTVGQFTPIQDVSAQDSTNGPAIVLWDV